MSVRSSRSSRISTPGSTSRATGSKTPITPLPRSRISIYQSPASTPSLSAHLPFDWNAVRAHAPPPYPTPQSKSKSRKSIGAQGPETSDGQRQRKSYIKKKSFVEKLEALPSRIAFEIALFPANVPLPTPKTRARLAGSFLHLLHFFLWIRQISQEPVDERDWKINYEDAESSWFHWSTLATILLFTAASLNTAYLFTRSKIYRLNLRKDPVLSPNASFVDQEDQDAPQIPIYTRVIHGLWRLFIEFWKFLLAVKSSDATSGSARRRSIQQLEVWSPGEVELALFPIYNHVHFFAWRGATSSNWLYSLMIMGIISAQLKFLVHSYKTLLKDKEIIAAEVLNEYNEGFVYPRVFPLKKDAGTMTHESELVDFWR